MLSGGVEALMLRSKEKKRPVGPIAINSLIFPEIHSFLIKDVGLNSMRHLIDKTEEALITTLQ